MEDLMPNQEMSGDRKAKMCILDGKLITRFFYKQRFLSTQPQCCLTFP